MKVIGTNGRKYPVRYRVSNSYSFKSQLEKEVFNILKEQFPYDNILYNWIIPGGTGNSVDFFIPRQKLIIECDGEQHHKFNKFFHNNYSDFIAQKYRDFSKDLFCSQNQILLIRINHSKELIQKLKEFYET